MKDSEPGTLIVASAPIGRPEDASPRLASALAGAAAVAGWGICRLPPPAAPPRGEGKRARRVAELADEPRTLVFFEAARRAATTLAELAAAFGPDRRAVVCRELSKTHEEIRRGTLGELAEWAAGGLLGEVTLAVAGRAQAPARDAPAAAAEVAARAAAGHRRTEASA